MKIVILKILCAIVILIVIAMTYVILQTLGEKGIKPFKNSIVRWFLSFITGILLFLLGVKFILT